jgi:hypothetical protein
LNDLYHKYLSLICICDQVGTFVDCKLWKKNYNLFCIVRIWLIYACRSETKLERNCFIDLKCKKEKNEWRVQVEMGVNVQSNLKKEKNSTSSLLRIQKATRDLFMFNAIYEQLEHYDIIFHVFISLNQESSTHIRIWDAVRRRRE